MPETLLKLSEVLEITKTSKDTLYRWMRLPKQPFPSPLKLGGQPGRRTNGAVRWRASEVEEWISSRPRANAVNGRGR